MLNSLTLTRDDRKELARRLAYLLNLPRPYGTWSRNSYSWVNQDGKPVELTENVLTELLFKDVVTVSVQDYDEEHKFFNGHQSFAIFDVDSSNLIESAAAADKLYQQLLTEVDQNQILITFSGNKGYHLWIFLDKSYPIPIIRAWQNSQLEKIGSIVDDGKHGQGKYYLEDVCIETLNSESGRGYLVKIPFSLYPPSRVEGRWEVPIYPRELNGKIVDGFRLSLVNYYNIQKSTPKTLHRFKNITEMKSGFDNPRKSYNKSRTQENIFNVILPVVGDTEQQNRIKELLNGDKAPPCIKYCYKRTHSNLHGIYSERAVIVAYLSKKGVAANEIGVYFRDNICDAEDLSNKGVLEYQTGYWYNRQNIISCDTLANQTSKFFCCPEVEPRLLGENVVCGRGSPTSEPYRLRSLNNGASLDATKKFDKIFTHAKKILRMFDNTLVTKTTRAGVTTSLTIQAMVYNQRVIIMVPNTAIIKETLIDISSIIKKYYSNPMSAVGFLANKEICLINLEEIIELKEQFGEDVKAEYMPFWIKPECSTCRYRKPAHQVNIISNNAILHSSLYGEYKKCAYVSIVNQIKDVKVLYLTYDKLRALLQSTSDEAREIMKFINSADKILFDEVSQLSEAPNFQLQLKLNKSVDVIDKQQNFSLKQIEFDLLFVLTREIEGDFQLYLEDHPEGKFLRILLYGFINYFELSPGILEFDDYRNFKVLKPDFYDLDHFRDNFTKLYLLVHNYVKQTNRSLKYVTQVLLLLNEQEWILVKQEKDKIPLNIQIITAPKVYELIQIANEWAHEFKMILTDAALPAIELSKIFGFDYTTYDVGDPREIVKKQTIIPDSKNIRNDMIFKRKGRERAFQDDLISVLRKILERHSTDKLLIICANQDTYFQFLEILKEENIELEKNQISYFRAAKLTGVASPYRVCLTIGAPLAPSGSFDWLAYYYQDKMPELSFEELSHKLLETNAQMVYYQNTSRVKDPHGIEESFVYSWGMTKSDIETMMGITNIKPKIEKVSARNGLLKYLGGK